MRLATHEDLNRTAVAIVRTAMAAGWTVTPTYANKGSVESVALRMRRGGRRAVAVFVNGGFAAAWTWSATQPIRRMGARELTREVAT